MIYIYVLLSLLLLMLIYKTVHKQGRTNNRIILLMFVILALLSGFRYEDGIHADFHKNYVNTIRTGRLSWSEALTVSTEFLHTVYRKLVMSVFQEPQVYFIITAFFIVGVFVLIYKKYSPDITFSIVAFYCVFGYFSSNNITRQYIAIAITMLSWKYIIEKKPIKFYFCVLLASGFHMSAIVVIPLYHLASRPFTRNMLYIYAIIGSLIVVLNRQVTAVLQMFLYSNYGGGYGSESSNALRLVWTFLAIGSLWLLSHKQNEFYCPSIDDPEQLLRLKGIITHGTVMNCFFQFLSVMNMLLFTRVAAYFTACMSLAILYGINTFNYKKNRMILKTGFLLLIIVWFGVMNYTGKLSPAHYEFFWNAR